MSESAPTTKSKMAHLIRKEAMGTTTRQRISRLESQGLPPGALMLGDQMQAIEEPLMNDPGPGRAPSPRNNVTELPALDPRVLMNMNGVLAENKKLHARLDRCERQIARMMSAMKIENREIAPKKSFSADKISRRVITENRGNGLGRPSRSSISPIDASLFESTHITPPSWVSSKGRTHEALWNYCVNKLVEKLGQSPNYGEAVLYYRSKGTRLGLEVEEGVPAIFTSNGKLSLEAESDDDLLKHYMSTLPSIPSPEAGEYAKQMNRPRYSQKLPVPKKTDKPATEGLTDVEFECGRCGTTYQPGTSDYSDLCDDCENEIVTSGEDPEAQGFTPVSSDLDGDGDGDGDDVEEARSPNSNFGRRGAYRCDNCGHLTRSTGGGDAEEVGMCDDCYEQGGLENFLSDHGPLGPDDQARLDELDAKINARIAKNKGKATESVHGFARKDMPLEEGIELERILVNEFIPLFGGDQVLHESLRRVVNSWRSGDLDTAKMVGICEKMTDKIRNPNFMARASVLLDLLPR